jgi:CubicO group peptidase (beta-lactamase class C family)
VNCLNAGNQSVRNVPRKGGTSQAETLVTRISDGRQTMDAADREAVDALAESYQRRGGQPGIAYGVVAGGRLVHAGGFGQRRAREMPDAGSAGAGRVPDAGTVFRIASMTKSFTASAVLTLRDEGALSLDDLAEDYVPELRGWPAVTPDAQRVRIRHLLTMTAGFPTDDPWGDRQQGTPLPEFSAFLSGGVSFAWAPGTRFEYSNLGYAILGRVISAVTGAPYPDVIRTRLLAPLGMARTGFEAAEFAPGNLAAGHRRAAGGWSEIPPAPCGAFAPMGGVFSCVQDLAVWVAGFAAAFPPGPEDTGGPHPLSRSARREMQLPQVATGARFPVPMPGSSATGSYGFGLFVEDDPVWGRIVLHSGGYPGFGSNMRWHAATGLGVIVLGNSTYAPVGPFAVRLLTTVLRQEAHRAVPDRAAHLDGSAHADRALALAPAGPWPETVAARDDVAGLLQSWDDAVAGKLFSSNVALDEPFPERQRKIALIHERLGDFRDEEKRLPEFDTPAHCRWWVTGEDGTAQVEIRLSPERPARVQSLILAVPPAGASPLRLALDRIIALMNDGATSWPASVPAAPLLDREVLIRRLRMAAAWAGRCRAGAYRAGDGETAVTVELDGEFTRLLLTVAVDRTAGLLQQADIMLGL